MVSRAKVLDLFTTLHVADSLMLIASAASLLAGPVQGGEARSESTL